MSIRKVTTSYEIWQVLIFFWCVKVVVVGREFHEIEFSNLTCLIVKQTKIKWDDDKLFCQDKVFSLSLLLLLLKKSYISLLKSSGDCVSNWRVFLHHLGIFPFRIIHIMAESIWEYYFRWISLSLSLLD